MKAYYQKEKEVLLEEMESAQEGLTAAQVQERKEKYGPNSLREEKKQRVWQVFMCQFADLLVLILVVAAVISMLSGNVESTIVIFAVLILNAILGTVQHCKAEKSLDALKSLSSPHTKVRRDGEKIEINSTEVVPGDILLLEAGDMIVADGRILQAHSFQVNESALTGESANVEKNTEVISGEVALADRCNMVHSGTLVTYGRGEVLVTATAMDTEMGKIADLMNQTKGKRTPLQVSMDDFSKKLAIIIMVISALVLGLQIAQGNDILSSLMFAVALAVAAIPEALSSIVTIVQAMGTQKMADKGAIVKELGAVESLGCVSVICSDKTGTLTQNKMTVKQVYVEEHCKEPQKLSCESRQDMALLYNAVLNNDAYLSQDGEVGDPTEACLLVMARDAWLSKEGKTEKDIREKNPRLEELPFDSERKLMSSCYRFSGNKIMFTKGAVDVMLNRVAYYMTSEGIRKITQEDKQRILQQNEAFSQNGLRVLAFAYKEMEQEETLSFQQEQQLIFIGMTATMDPPREESAEAVASAKAAGIKTVMITGDHKITASAIAKEIGIFTEGDMAVTGQELDAMSEDILRRDLEKISVYARVSPENKIRIVNAWQEKGKIAAMTGDGVNDAPALKKADVGVAMGITGTEVSKDAAAMILTDDNFATIIKAVYHGRNVYRNIKNAIQFLLSGNMAGIICVLYCCLAGLPAPFAAVHLLFINLLTDSLPALAIGMEPAEKSLLAKQPRDPKEGIMTKQFLAKMMGYGGMIAAVTLVAYYLGNPMETPMKAATMAFATLTLARLFHGFNLRSNHSIFKIGICSNPWSVGAFLVGSILLVAVLTIPVCSRLFMTVSLPWTYYVSIVLLAAVPTILIQGKRLFRA